MQNSNEEEMDIKYFLSLARNIYPLRSYRAFLEVEGNTKAVVNCTAVNRDV